MGKTASKKTTSTEMIPVLVVAVALLLGGCGGGGDDSSATSVASSPEAAAKQAGKKSRSSESNSSSGGEAHKQGGSGKEAHGSKPSKADSAKQSAPVAAPEGPREPEPTPKQIEEATLASMSLSSPVLSPGPESISPLPAPYTCKGKDTWPELKWSGVPAGTQELALLALNIEPVDEALFFDWAITGLDPKLKGLESAQLPKGAIIGRNSFAKIGYSICPPSHETIIFALYALPSKIPAAKGFDPTALRKQVLEISGNSGLLAVSAG